MVRCRVLFLETSCQPRGGARNTLPASTSHQLAAEYRDGKKQWWLVFEHEFVPVAKKPLDLRELIRFGMDRMNAPSAEATWEELSWDSYFGVP